MFFSFSSRYLSLSLLICGVFASPIFAHALIREATFYSDSFEGGSTANGDIFHQSDYSAAICDIPLWRFLYVAKWGTGVVVEANDRPNCSRYPNIIDFSRDVFSLFGSTSLGRLSDIQVTDIGIAPTGQSKKFLSKESFSHLWITITSSIPSILFINQGIEIRWRVKSPSEYVIVYIAHTEDPDVKETSLVKVRKDGTFSTRILLPKKIGNYTFVIARGKSFNTDSYSTLTLIDPDNLDYPSLPTEKYRFIPRITFIGETPGISLGENIFSEINVTTPTWKYFQAQGTSLVFKDTGLPIWPANVRMNGYSLSTPSSLDRKSRINNFFSGSVFLDRIHDSIGSERVRISIKNNIANIRFTTPNDFFIRPNYYLILPDGDVKEYKFDSLLVGQNNFLKQWTVINFSVSLPKEGSYILEIVRQDGIAHVNVPLIRGNIWSIIDIVNDQKTRIIRKNTAIVQSFVLESINNLRKKVQRNPVVLDPTLTRLAQAKVDDMISRNYQAHADPDGKYIDSLAQKLNIDIEWSIGENIWFGTVSDIALQDGLEESGVHRYNMLSHSWNRVGIWYGIKDDKVYLVHVFGE